MLVNIVSFTMHEADIYWLFKHINVLMDESMACVGMWYHTHTHTDVLID